MMLYFDFDMFTSAAWKGIQPTVLQLSLRVISRDLQVCQCIITHMKLNRSPCDMHKLWLTLVHVHIATEAVETLHHEATGLC